MHQGIQKRGFKLKNSFCEMLENRTLFKSCTYLQVEATVNGSIAVADGISLLNVFKIGQGPFDYPFETTMYYATQRGLLAANCDW